MTACLALRRLGLTVLEAAAEVDRVFRGRIAMGESREDGFLRRILRTNLRFLFPAVSAVVLVAVFCVSERKSTLPVPLLLRLPR